jgi:hypothetical protein
VTHNFEFTLIASERTKEITRWKGLYQRRRKRGGGAKDV